VGHPVVLGRSEKGNLAETLGPRHVALAQVAPAQVGSSLQGWPTAN